MGSNFFQDQWNNPASDERSEIVFAHRKKIYGAYILRREYAGNLLRSLCIAITLVTFVFLAPYILNVLATQDSSHGILSEEISLAEPPPIDKLTPPPPPVIIPPPVQQTIKFTPPKIVRDEEADEPPPTQEEMKDVQVSTVTQEGTNEDILPPENPAVPTPEEDKIFSFVEEMPSFPGGEKKMVEFILSNIHYPPVALENNISGKVYVKFTVDKEGKITNTELLKGIGGGCDEEAMRILKLMPDWIPGRQNGNKVKVGGIVLHIDFTLR